MLFPFYCLCFNAIAILFSSVANYELGKSYIGMRSYFLHAHMVVRQILCNEDLLTVAC